jgi:hypothetical protein
VIGVAVFQAQRASRIAQARIAAAVAPQVRLGRQRKRAAIGGSRAGRRRAAARVGAGAGARDAGEELARTAPTSSGKLGTGHGRSETRAT